MNKLNHQTFIFMGVTACGKTYLGNLWAKHTNGIFIDAYDLHSGENKYFMSQRIALTDDQRWPWLYKIAHTATLQAQQGPVIIACSALKIIYRDFFRRQIPSIKFIYLKATPDLIVQRFTQRQNHFMSELLIQSQFEILDEPLISEIDVMIIDTSWDTNYIIEHIEKKFNTNHLLIHSIGEKNETIV